MGGIESGQVELESGVVGEFKSTESLLWKGGALLEKVRLSEERSYFRKRCASSVNVAIILTPHHNPFRAHCRNLLDY